jgi:hypothetical protein
MIGISLVSASPVRGDLSVSLKSLQAADLRFYKITRCPRPELNHSPML